MQSVEFNMRAVTRVAALLLSTVGFGTVVHVPTDVPTIQAALDSISEGDTILVNQGVYTEELTAPAFGFSLIGDVVPDTGLYLRPIIDPSELDSPTTRTCLETITGNVVIEQMWFKNGAAMHPHDNNTVGGVRNSAANLVIRDCVFDSTYRGVVSPFLVTLERCIFRASKRNCIYMANATLRAFDCDFECIETEWAAIIASSGTVVTRCRLHGSMGNDWDWWFNVYGESWLVRDNVFGPGGGSARLIQVGGTGGVFENNLITECRTRGALMGVGPECEGLIEIRNNTFLRNIIQGEEWRGTLCLSVYAQSDSFSTCSEVLVTDNEFIENEGGSIVKGILTSGHDIITRNSFRGLLPDSQWTVLAFYNDPLIRDNMFFDNGKAVRPETGRGIHAEYNWWGHETGPYHPTLNPVGQGDEVGDGVDFIPWYTDTLFFSASPEPRPPLPESVSILAYPNPFNSVATIKLTVPRAMIARIELFDVTGRRVKEVWSGAVADTKTVTWQADDFASGLYFVRAWDPLGNRPLALAKVVLLR